MQVVLKLLPNYQEVQKSSREGFANLTTNSDYNHLAKHVNANRFA
jgi:hypothetical protein